MSTGMGIFLALAVGLPCVLLALAIVYHARVGANPMPLADDGWEPDDEEAISFPFPEPEPYALEPDPVLVELQRTVTDLQEQLAQQRSALTGLLSTQERLRDAPASPVMNPVMNTEEPIDLRTAVRRLATEGLSDRSIARRLRVGLEEVRLVAQQEGRAS